MNRVAATPAVPTATTAPPAEANARPCVPAAANPYYTAVLAASSSASPDQAQLTRARLETRRAHSYDASPRLVSNGDTCAIQCRAKRTCSRHWAPAQRVGGCLSLAAAVLSGFALRAPLAMPPSISSRRCGSTTLIHLDLNSPHPSPWLGMSAELNERFNAVPRLPEEDVVKDECLFCVAVRVLVAHLREPNPACDNYLPFQGRDRRGRCLPAAQARSQCTGSASVSRHIYLPSCLSPGAQAENDSPTTTLPTEDTAAHARAPLAVGPATRTEEDWQELLHFFTPAVQLRTALPVSVKLLHALVQCLYPRALRRHVRSGSRPDWLLFIQRRVGLVVLSFPVAWRGELQCALGAWPWQRREPQPDAFQSHTYRLNAALRRVRACTDHLGSPVGRSCGIEVAWKELAQAVCAAHDDIVEMKAAFNAFQHVLAVYYNRAEVVLHAVNELLIYLLERACAGVEPAPWQTYPHVLTMAVSKLRADDPSVTEETGLLDKSTLFKFCVELAAQMVQRHDVYRHVGFTRMFRALMRCTILVTADELQLAAETSPGDPFAESLRWFVLPNVTLCPECVPMAPPSVIAE